MFHKCCSLTSRRPAIIAGLICLMTITANSEGYAIRKSGKPSVVSLPSSWEELESKLNLILDNESREKDLLQHLLEKKSSTQNVALGGTENLIPVSEQEQGEGKVEESNEETIPTRLSAEENPAEDEHLSRNRYDDEPAGMSTAAEERRAEEEGADNENDDVGLKKEQQRIGEKREGTVGGGVGDGANANPAEASVLVKKLEENSKRLESMVVFFADLRNVLSQAVASQEKQVALRGEVVELREEMENLRQEVEKLRSEQSQAKGMSGSRKLDNKIHNDETTIAWLKDSVEELRHGMAEVSAATNVTGMVHLRQQWDSELNRVHGDVKSLRSDLDALKGAQAMEVEASLEMKGDIADLRTWQIKMGQKFLQEEQEGFIQDEETRRLSLEKEAESGGVMTKRLTFPSEDSAEKGKRRLARSHGSRHQRKLKSELTRLEKVIRDVMRDENGLHNRLVKLEKKCAGGKGWENRAVIVMDAAGGVNNNKDDDKLSNRIGISGGTEEAHEATTTSTWKTKKSDKRRQTEEHGMSNSYRLTVLEKSLADYANTLEGVNDKVDSLAHLRESTTQLFTALETLESKYDERLTEMQTGLSRMEAAVSKTSITNDELGEQQILQSKIVQSLKKDFLGTRDQVNTNHIRLATVHSQLLKWGLQTCSDLTAESIQNIKIASLEARVSALAASSA